MFCMHLTRFVVLYESKLLLFIFFFLQFDKEQDMTMAALNTMPSYNNHRLLRKQDAEKVDQININDDNEWY